MGADSFCLSSLLAKTPTVHPWSPGLFFDDDDEEEVVESPTVTQHPQTGDGCSAPGAASHPVDTLRIPVTYPVQTNHRIPSHGVPVAYARFPLGFLALQRQLVGPRIRAPQVISWKEGRSPYGHFTHTQPNGTVVTM